MKQRFLGILLIAVFLGFLWFLVSLHPDQHRNISSNNSTALDAEITVAIFN